MEDGRIALGFSCSACHWMPEARYEKSEWLRFVEIGEMTLTCPFCKNSETVLLRQETKAEIRRRCGTIAARAMTNRAY
jgi:hypothetical protein